MNCGMRPQTEGIITNALADVYANVHQIGCGGMGHVFKVIDEHGFTKALKINKVGISTEELRNEFNLMQRLLHPRIAVVYGWVTFRKVHGFELKLYANGDLHRAIDNGTFDEFQTLRFTRDILSGLAFIHSKQIVHRDLKPGNILLDDDLRGLITDFGIAIHLSQVEPGCIGTKSYIAPEMQKGLVYDTSLDIWCFARILHALIYGDPIDPPHLQHVAVPASLKEVIVYADCEEPGHRKAAHWFYADSNVIFATTTLKRFPYFET